MTNMAWCDGAVVFRRRVHFGTSISFPDPLARASVTQTVGLLARADLDGPRAFTSGLRKQTLAPITLIVSPLTESSKLQSSLEAPSNLPTSRPFRPRHYP